MKKPLAEIIPLILARSVAPTAAVASGLLSPPALGAPGDLDPSFGDVGRVTEALDFSGTAWSVQPLDGGGSIFAGGHESSFYSFDFSDEGFEGRLSDTGSLESSFHSRNTEVRDLALQSDGKAVAVGRELSIGGSPTTLTVLRLGTNGSLDSTFGSKGLVRFPEGERAYSVTIDGDGRIVVAGRQDDGALMVLRLLDTGALDTTFGTDGIFLGDSTDSVPTQILSAAGGGYRVGTSDCRVVALTAQGTLDTSFGDSGIATLEPPSPGNLSCTSLVAQANGRLLLGGGFSPDNADPPNGFAVRLLTSGDPDASFDATAVSSNMGYVTALAVDGSGSILVAGRAFDSVPAALVMRLQATGTLDGLFGNSGSSWIDLPDHNPLIHDMSVLSDGRILVAGGTEAWSAFAQPFVARLLGNTGGGPGVLGIAKTYVNAEEQSHEAVIPVRRMGGSQGEVSVRYQITTTLDSDIPPATAGQDFTAVTGRVTWRDGEAQDQEIRVPISSTDEIPESLERFLVTLDDAQGQAGLGTRSAAVDIEGTVDPAGRFDFEVAAVTASEASGFANVTVARHFYGKGPVSVTVTPVAGTATADSDFAPEPITVSWVDNDFTSRIVQIPLRNDSTIEQRETFTVQLSNPTGGAFIGPDSTATVSIVDDDATKQNTSQGGGGGGGAFGILSVLLLGAVRFLRTLFRPGHRGRAPP